MALGTLIMSTIGHHRNGNTVTSHSSQGEGQLGERPSLWIFDLYIYGHIYIYIYTDSVVVLQYVSGKNTSLVNGIVPSLKSTLVFPGQWNSPIPWSTLVFHCSISSY